MPSNALVSDGTMEKIKVTLLLPSYNHEPYIEEAIRSVYAQTDPFDRIIFFSDGSKDRTLEIARDLFRNDSRVTWLPDLDVNIGIVARMRQMSQNVFDGLIMGISGDDLLKPRACETFRELARVHPFEWAIGATEISDQDLRLIKTVYPPAMDNTYAASREFFRRLLRLQLWLPAQAWCFSANLLHRVGAYDSCVRVEDYSLALRFALATTPVITSEVIAVWRKLEGSFTRVYGEEMWADHARTALQFLSHSPFDALPSASGSFRQAQKEALRRRRWMPALAHGMSAIGVWPSPRSIMSVLLAVIRSAASG
jgi:alpha-1,3-rhamnosyltransferase